jgi:hypothetical protein
MSNYTKTTNFATKDSLSSGDPAKKIKGTEFNTEFDNIVTAIATKADLASPALTGTPTAPTAAADTNTTQIATTAFVQTAMTAAGAGTVTSVAVTSSDATVTGSPITGSGTIDIALNTVPVNKGGTGQTSYTDGQLLIGNTSGNTLTKATLTAGSGVSITNGNGSITIAATGTSGVSTFSGGSTGLTPSSATSGAITLGGTLAVANGGTGSTTASGARTNLGLGSIATQNSSSVSISGGSISGITDLAIADGGTGASTAANARTNLGLGSMATASTSDYVNVASGQFITGEKAFTSVTGFGADNPGTTWNVYMKGQNSHPTLVVETGGSAGQCIALATNGSNAAQLFYWGSAVTPGSPVGGIDLSSTSTSYNTSSDYRLKTNVQPMTDAVTKIKALKPVTYTWKKDGSVGQGFIAHELQAVFPDAVTGAKDAVDLEGKPKYQGVDTSFLVGALTAALQEALARIEALEAKVQ